MQCKEDLIKWKFGITIYRQKYSNLASKWWIKKKKKKKKDSGMSALFCPVHC